MIHASKCILSNVRYFFVNRANSSLADAMGAPRRAGFAGNSKKLKQCLSRATAEGLIEEESMTKRAVRHDVIRDIIRRGGIKTQRDLVDQLREEGYDCTQATVSRDIAGMGLAKSRDGYYVLPEDLRLQRMVGELVEGVDVVNNFLVVRTPSGIASGVAVALDAARLKGIAGTLAGDDTIFVMCYTEDDAKKVAEIIGRLRDR